MTRAQKISLKKIFGDRCTFKQNELVLYAHDQSSLPDQVSLMLNSMPDAVVQPINRTEVKKLVVWAKKNKVPITPRAGGTSAVFGSVAVKGGVIVDIRRLNSILDLDEKNKTVTVEAGVVWLDLEEYLNEKGYSLLSYPSSSPSAMIAGWIAQGGIGVGSFEHGHVETTVKSLDMINPSREMKDITGRELEMVADCMGITGIIVQVTLKIRKNDPQTPTVIMFDNEDLMCDAIEEIRTKIPVWHLNWANPTFLRLQQEATGHNILPDGMWLVNVVMPSKRLAKYKKRLRAISMKYKGLMVGEYISQEEWSGRFYPMRFAKFGPTLVPSEVYLPAKNIRKMIALMAKKLKLHEVAYEGSFSSKDETTVLAFIKDDERRVEYPLSWGFSFAIVNLAQKLGGRVYQVGAFLGSKLSGHFGQGRLKAIAQFKKQQDPNHILNPGKIVSKSWRIFPLMGINSLLFVGAWPMSLACRLLPHNLPEPDILGSHAISETIEHFDKSGPIHIREFYNCIQCGYCNRVCPTFKASQWESHGPRGRIASLMNMTSRTSEEQETGQKVIPNPEFVKSLYCTLCFKCQTVCHVDIQFIHMWENAKEYFTENGLTHPDMMYTMFNAIHDSKFHNPFQEPRSKRNEWYKEDYNLPAKAEIVYFKGCMDSYYEYKTLKNVLKIFTKAGLDFTTMGTDEMCCGAPLAMAGLTTKSDKIAKHNVEEIMKRGAKLVVTACPGCMRSLKKYEQYMGKLPFKVKHVLEVVADLIRDGKLPWKKKFKKNPIIYHDPCELGRASEFEGHGLFDEPRYILKNVPGVEDIIEFKENRMDSNCCGGGGVMKAVDLELSQKIGIPKIEEAEAKGAATLVSACPSCNATLGTIISIIKEKRKVEGKKFKMGMSDVCDVVAKAL